MAARTSPRNARYLALLGLAILSASAYLIVRPFKSAPAPDRRIGARAEGAPSVESPVTPLDSTVTRGRERIAADAAPGSGVDAPAKADKPAVAFAVEVVDADGKPVAGVPVSATLTREESTLAVALTDETGRATLRVEGEWVGRDETIQIGTPFVGTTPPSAACTLATPPKERMRFVLEPSGSIEIVLVGGGNIEFTEDDECTLRIDEDRSVTERLAGLHERLAWMPLTSRTLVVPRVRTGLSFEVSCRLRGMRFDSVRFGGPREAGERVRVEVPFLSARTLIRGRCLDISGVRLFKHGYELVVSPEDWGMGPRTIVRENTDETGSFRAYVDRERLPQPGTSIEIHTMRGGARAMAGRLKWPEPIAALTAESGPMIDLGDIVLESLPLLATGRIVDAHGKPTWGRVEMRVIRNSTVSWSSMEETYAGKDGSFQVATAFVPERFELRAMSRGKSPSDPVELVPGARDVVLTLREASRINGRVLLPAGIAMEQLNLEFACTDPADEPHHHVFGYDSLADGSFYAEELLPGTYRVLVQLGAEELAAREAVIPKQGGNVNLEPIDLREVVHGIGLTVVAEGSDRKFEGSASIVSGEESVSTGDLNRDGNVVLAARTKTVDVVAWVPGFRMQRFNAVESGARLVLERGLPTSLRLESEIEVPEPLCVTLDLRLQADGALGQCAGEIYVPLGKDGRASTHLPASGTYRVMADLTSKTDRWGSNSSFHARFEVERSLDGGLEELVIRVNDEALRKAIAEAQRK